jgi:replication factor C subunit 1
LPTQSTFSCFLPGEYMSGSFNAAVSFPSWLGKFSRSNKRKRLAQEIHDHTRISTSGSRLSVRLDYAQFLVAAIIRPLKENGLDGVQDALKVIREYRLLREDIDSLLELSTWSKQKNPWESIDSKVKAALTRAYNKEIQPFSYSVQSSVKKKSAKSSDDYDDPENEEVRESESEEEESLEKNSLIKVKKPSQTKGTKATKSTAKTSKSKK